jgi:hypothetical protein
MTVGELLARISGEEITEWAAYERLRGPLGPVRGDWQAAVVASTVYAVMAGKKARRRKLKDFLPKWAGDRRASTDEAMEALGRRLAAMYGGEWTEGGAGVDDR